ncbi:hypothetical protein BDB00DRAFT_738006, partial [Zychaea mexicana]|uniref:uncharacterized protein n=1 Tax=Zychaea mexicana TaxID=64656 RepID=UPI0022FE749A
VMDGIGFNSAKLERILVECSGYIDGTHTEEDTLKLMECSHHCLNVEMKKRQSASWNTFNKRRVLSVQCVGDKITLLSTSLLPSGKWS